MADRKAIATGNWNNPAIWDGGVAVPTSSDDVYANGFTVTINQNVTCLSLRTTSGTGIVAGGGFTMSSPFDVTANIIAGTTICLTIAATTGTVTVTGNITGTATTNAAFGISHSGGCNLVVIGTCTGGTFANNSNAVSSGGAVGNLTVTGSIVAAANNTVVVAFAPTLASKTFTFSGTTTTAANGICISVSGAPAGGTVANITAAMTAVAAGQTVSVAGTNPTVNITCTGGFTSTLGQLLNTASVGGTIVVNGDIRHGTLVGTTVNNGMTSSGQLTINGNVYGPTASSSGNTVSTNGVNTTIINGNIIGASGTASGNCWTVTNGVSSTVTINGDVTGGTAGAVACVNNSGSGTLNVNGTATGGTSTIGAAHGVVNTGTGTCFVRTAKSNDYPNGGNTQQAFGTIQSNVSGWITVDSMEDGSGGWPACSGRHFIRAAGTNFCKMRESNAGAITTMGEVGADYPVVANVRSGTVYNFGAQTGTLAVPPVGSVALGVPTDNTVGSAMLTGVTLAAIEASTILAMKADVTGVPAAVRTNLAAELARIDVAISSRLAAAGYTAPLDATATQAAAALALAAYSPATLAALVAAVAALTAEHDATQAAIAALPAPDNTSIAKIKANAALIPALL